MSAPQGSSACRITVDPSTADVLRVEAKKVLMFNHELFEDFLDYIPARQLALADVYRDATAVVDAVGWDLDTEARTQSVEVPLTSGHIQQLHKRRWDLLDTNLDLLTTSVPTAATMPSSWPRSTTTATASKLSTRFSTPTPTGSPHKPSHVRCGPGPATDLRQRHRQDAVRGSSNRSPAPQHSSRGLLAAEQRATHLAARRLGQVIGELDDAWVLVGRGRRLDVILQRASEIVARCVAVA
jgi:hypothetical protein